MKIKINNAKQFESAVSKLASLESKMPKKPSNLQLAQWATEVDSVLPALVRAVSKASRSIRKSDAKVGVQASATIAGSPLPKVKVNWSVLRSLYKIQAKRVKTLAKNSKHIAKHIGE